MKSTNFTPLAGALWAMLLVTAKSQSPLPAAPTLRSCVFPISAHIDDEEVKTSLMIKVPLLEIRQSVDDWLSKKHESPDDKTLATILQALKDKQVDVIKKLVLSENGFGIDDPGSFVDLMQQAAFPEGYKLVVDGKTYTDEGVLYTLEHVGNDPYSGTILLKEVDPVKRKFMWEITPERSCDSVLVASFGLDSANISSDSAGSWNPATLVQIFAQAVSNDQSVYDGIRGCIDLIGKSQMKDGMTEQSEEDIRHGLSKVDESQQKDIVNNFSKDHTNLKFVIDAGPLYVAFFQTPNEMVYSYFVKQQGKYLMTNISQVDEFDRYIKEFVASPAIQTVMANAPQSSAPIK